MGEGVGLLEKGVGMHPALIEAGERAFGWRRWPQGAFGGRYARPRQRSGQPGFE